MVKPKDPDQLKNFSTFGAVNTTLNNQEIKYLYELLFYLSDLQKTGKTSGFYIDNKELKKFLKEKSIALDYKTQPVMHYDKNRIIFTKGSSACYFLLKHIRNAFAHGGLTREKNVFVIEDKYQGKVTAYGRINHKLLFLLIDKIVRTKK